MFDRRIETPDERQRILIDGGKWGIADMEDYVRRFVPTTEPSGTPTSSR